MITNTEKLRQFKCEFFLVVEQKKVSASSSSMVKDTAQKMKFSIKDFFSKCDQI